MLLIVRLLQLPAAHCLLHRAAHGIRDHIRVHDDMALRISCSTANCLNQRYLRTQESFLICIQNRHERYLRNIQSLPKQIDADQHIKYIQAHIADDLRPLQRINVRMQIPHPDSDLFHIVGQIFCHPLRQRRHEYLIPGSRLLIDLSDQVVNLSLHRTHLDLRIQQPGRTDDLLRPQQLVLRLVVSGRRRHKEHLIQLALKLIEIQRTVVLCGRQAKTIVDQRRLPRLVSDVHCPHLRYGLVRLIDNQKIVIPEIIHQCMRCRPGRHPGQMAGIVLNAGTKAGLTQHLYIIVRPLCDPLRLQQLVLALKIFYALGQLLLNRIRCPQNFIHRNNIMGRRENSDKFQSLPNLTGQRVDFGNPVDLISEKFYPIRILIRICRKNLQHIAPDTKRAAVEIHIVPVILDIDQLMDDLVPVALLPLAEIQHHVLIVCRAAQSVNAGNARHNDDILPFDQRGRRR